MGEMTRRIEYVKQLALRVASGGDRDSVAELRMLAEYVGLRCGAGGWITVELWGSGFPLRVQGWRRLGDLIANWGDVPGYPLAVTVARMAMGTLSRDEMIDEAYAEHARRYPAVLSRPAVDREAMATMPGANLAERARKRAAYMALAHVDDALAEWVRDEAPRYIPVTRVLRLLADTARDAGIEAQWKARSNAW